MLDPVAVELCPEQIGSGATSRVFKGKFCESGKVVREVACKEFMVSITPKHKIRLMKEIRCLKLLRHPNILSHFGVDFNRSLLVTELLGKKIEIDGAVINIHNARELLDTHEFKTISWSTRIKIMHGVTSGLSFLHAKNIVHCDLKAANVFVGDDGEDGLLVKLGDFGTALFDFAQFSVSVMPAATNTDNSVMCTAAYTAPELLERGAKPSFESDVYSLAMVMIEFSLPSRSTPWEGEVANSSIIYDFVRRGERPSVSVEDLSGLKSEMASQWISLLRECWDQNPTKRPTSAEAALKMSSLYSEEFSVKYKSFQEWKIQNQDVLFISLNTHQGMTIEVLDELVCGFASKNETMSSELNLDLTENLYQNDGSNACVYLCSKIADELIDSSLLCGQDNHIIVKRVSEDTIRKLPKRINSSRSIRELTDVDQAIQVMNQNEVICNKYNTTELLEKQSSKTLHEKHCYLKRALTCLEQSVNTDGKAFAIYLCRPLAILVGVLRSSFIIVDTHKVPEEAGGTQYGLIVQFTFDTDKKETVIDNIVEWISIRMRASIQNYSTSLHSLVLLQVIKKSGTDIFEFDISDVDDEELLNASLEAERNEGYLPSVVNDHSEQQQVSGHCFEVDEPTMKGLNASVDMKGSECSPSPKLNMEKNHIGEQSEIQQIFSPRDNVTVNDKDNTIHLTNYILPKDLPDVKHDDSIVWKGHLTRFGLNSLNDFQMYAIQSVQLGRDTIVVQATGSGKSLCFQLPSLFDRQKFVVVVTPTISLINSQIEELKKLNIDAIALGRSAGQDAKRNDDRLFYNNGTSPLPSLVFMTPEHFVNRVCYSLEENKESIKLLVLDEVHKMFDRNSNFRSCYDFFKGIKERFPCVPVMALTATLSKGQLQSLCVDYLRNPVLIKSSINRSNIKLNIKSYVHTKKSTSSTDGNSSSKEGIWCACATDIKNITGDEYAIIFMDFRSDVELMTSSLRLQIGEENVIMEAE